MVCEYLTIIVKFKSQEFVKEHFKDVVVFWWDGQEQKQDEIKIKKNTKNVLERLKGLGFQWKDNFCCVDDFTN